MRVLVTQMGSGRWRYRLMDYFRDTQVGEGKGFRTYKEARNRGAAAREEYILQIQFQPEAD